jgi:hypothetical protein
MTLLIDMIEFSGTRNKAELYLKFWWNMYIWIGAEADECIC